MACARHEVYRRDGRYLCDCGKVTREVPNGQDTVLSKNLSRYASQWVDTICSTCEEKAKTKLTEAREGVAPLPEGFTIDDVGDITSQQRDVWLTETHYREAAERGWVGMDREGEWEMFEVGFFQDSEGNWLTNTNGSPSYYSIDWRRAWCQKVYCTEDYNSLAIFTRLPTGQHGETDYAGGPRNETLYNLVRQRGQPVYPPRGEVWVDNHGRLVGEYGYFVDTEGRVIDEWLADARANTGQQGSTHRLWLLSQSREVQERMMTPEQLEAFDALTREEEEQAWIDYENEVDDAVNDSDHFPDHCWE